MLVGIFFRSYESEGYGMEFNLGRKYECTDCKLKSLAGCEDVEIEYIQFRKSSIFKISDIMKRGVQKDNQDLIADSVVLKRTEYDKLTDKRYKAIFVGLADVGNNIVSAIEFILSNVDILFNVRDVEIKDDYVEISLAHIIVYPMGVNSFRELGE